MPTIRPLSEAERRLFEEQVAAAVETGRPKPFAVSTSFLDRSVRDIIPDLKGLPAEDLESIRLAELHGKTRKSLIEAIDAMGGVG